MSLNSTQNSVNHKFNHLICHQICHLIFHKNCHQKHHQTFHLFLHQFWWITKFVAKFSTKFITKFSDSLKSSPNLSPNSSPNSSPNTLGNLPHWHCSRGGKPSDDYSIKNKYPTLMFFRHRKLFYVTSTTITSIHKTSTLCSMKQLCHSCKQWNKQDTTHARSSCICSSVLWSKWFDSCILRNTAYLIAHICHFLYTGKIFKFQSLHLNIPKIYPQKESNM